MSCRRLVMKAFSQVIEDFFPRPGDGKLGAHAVTGGDAAFPVDVAREGRDNDNGAATTNHQ
jgi:hypothetical protein